MRNRCAQKQTAEANAATTKLRTTQKWNWKPATYAIFRDLNTKDCCTETCASCGIKNDLLMIWDQCKLKQNGFDFPMNMECDMVKKNMEGEAFQAWRNQTTFHEDDKGVFANKVVGEEVKRMMTCSVLGVTKQGVRLCEKNTLAGPLNTIPPS
mmetsp:Transcript_9207/g.18836  ORF Transcript_9207/g.18836 Transcript_9207/m.18836 type:complete len:153 (+) Transcript_9207:41-499(+)